MLNSHYYKDLYHNKYIEMNNFALLQTYHLDKVDHYTSLQVMNGCLFSLDKDYKQLCNSLNLFLYGFKLWSVRSLLSLSLNQTRVRSDNKLKACVNADRDCEGLSSFKLSFGLLFFSAVSFWSVRSSFLWLWSKPGVPA